MDLTETERSLLQAGLVEWLGRARSTDALAVAMGFADRADLLSRVPPLADKLAAGEDLSLDEWDEALVATEIAFVSRTLGSGRDWPLTTGFADDTTIALLREIQRKIGVAHLTARGVSTHRGSPRDVGNPGSAPAEPEA